MFERVSFVQTNKDSKDILILLYIELVPYIEREIRKLLEASNVYV